MPLNAIQTDYTPGRPSKQNLDRRRHADDEMSHEAAASTGLSAVVDHPNPWVAGETTAAIVNLERGATVAFDFAVRRYASV